MTGYPVLNCSVRKSLSLSPLFVFLLLIFARVPVVQASDYRSLHEASAPPKVVAWRQSPARKTGSDSLVSQGARELTMLETGKTFERELSAEQKHEYQITLAEGQYASVIVEQRGIDLIVQLLAADGNSIVDFNNEIRNEGEEKIELVAKTAGAYRLLVKAKYPNLPAGRYEIRLTEVRAAAEKDRLLYEARGLETVSRQLWGAGKFAEALPLGERALELQERVWGTDHPDLAFPLINVAVIKFFQGDYAKAEELCQRGLTIDEKALGPEHWRVGRLR